MLSPRIIGLETEYGCLIESTLETRPVLRLIRDWFFEEQRFGLVDLHHRDWEEPPGNGGFLFNGGRIYIDMGHFEFCTPECSSLRDVIRYDRVGDRLLTKATEALDLTDKVQFFRNNIDHYTGATFGCHENYLMDRNAPLTEKNVLSLLAFQTLRVLFTGTGRVGSAPALDYLGQPLEDSESVPFQICQRADHIENDFFQWVQHNRAIVNTRDEPLADPYSFRRLHVLHGDTNVMPSNLFLKIGATSLVLDLLEEDNMPEIILADGVSTLRSLSRLSRPPWNVLMADGTTEDAVELLHEYWFLAHQEFSGRDEETNAVLDLWERVLNGLSGDLDALVSTLDWVGKKHLLGEFVAQENVDWDDPWISAQDLEFHHIDPDRCLGLALGDCDGIWNPENIESGLSEPPLNSRAALRSEIMRELQLNGRSYLVDWDRIEDSDQGTYHLQDPYETNRMSIPTSRNSQS